MISVLWSPLTAMIVMQHLIMQMCACGNAGQVGMDLKRLLDDARQGPGRQSLQQQISQACLAGGSAGIVQGRRRVCRCVAGACIPRDAS